MLKRLETDKKKALQNTSKKPLPTKRNKILIPEILTFIIGIKRTKKSHNYNPKNYKNSNGSRKQKNKWRTTSFTKFNYITSQLYEGMLMKSIRTNE